MGGRGGGSGRGGGAATTTRDRGKTGHLASGFVGREDGIQLLVKETGMSRAEAEQSYNAMEGYFGSDYSFIRAGKPPSEALKGKLIDKALSKARPYNGEIYRGIHLSDSEYASWSKALQKGATMDMKGISSWSSKTNVAESFARKGSLSGQSIIFKVKSTNKAVPVQHLSHFGSGEAEVLAPSTVKYAISSYKTVGKTTYINLAEVG